MKKLLQMGKSETDEYYALMDRYANVLDAVRGLDWSKITISTKITWALDIIFNKVIGKCLVFSS